MTAVLHAYDKHTFTLRGEITGVTKVNWSDLLNKIPQLTFTIGRTHPKANLYLLDRHGVIRCWNDAGDPWDGYIVRRHWNKDALEVTCFGVLNYLNRRRTRPAKITNKPPGVHFAHMLAEANGHHPTGITVGDVWKGGGPLTIEYQTEKTYDKIQNLLDLAEIDTSLSLRCLTMGAWALSLVPDSGRDLTGSVILQAGVDTVDPPDYEEDDTDYANYIIEVGKDQTTTSTTDTGDPGDSIGDGGVDPGDGTPPPDPGGGDDNGGSGTTTANPAQTWAKKPKGIWSDPIQIGLEGLSEDIVDNSDVSDIHTLVRAARTEGLTREQPKRPLTVHLSRRSRFWGAFRAGDYIGVLLPGFGFSGISVPVQVVGREIDEDKQIQVLALVVVTGDRAATLTMVKAGNYNTGAGGQSLGPPE